MFRALCVVGAVGLLAFSAGESAGAASDGRIRVRVNDEEGIVLPGAVVRVGTASWREWDPAAQADGNGLVTLDHLETGKTYSLRVDFPGFVPLQVNAVATRDADAPWVVVQLIESVQQCVISPEHPKAVNLENHQVSSRYDADFLSDLPGHFARRWNEAGCGSPVPRSSRQRKKLRKQMEGGFTAPGR